MWNMESRRQKYFPTKRFLQQIPKKDYKNIWLEIKWSKTQRSGENYLKKKGWRKIIRIFHWRIQGESVGGNRATWELELDWVEQWNQERWGKGTWKWTRPHWNSFLDPPLVSSFKKQIVGLRRSTTLLNFVILFIMFIINSELINIDRQTFPNLNNLPYKVMNVPNPNHDGTLQT